MQQITSIGWGMPLVFKLLSDKKGHRIRECSLGEIMGIYCCRQQVEIDGIEHKFTIKVGEKWLAVAIDGSVERYSLVRNISSSVVEAVISRMQLQTLINNRVLVSCDLPPISAHI